MTELKACPFCGADDAGMLNPWASSVNYCVQCYTCGCSTAIFDTEEKAAAAWNRRAESGERRGGEAE